MRNLENKHIIILAHVLTTVPAEDLKTYFNLKKVNKVLFIAHPLFFRVDRPGPYYELYEKGKLIKKVQYKNRKFPSIVQFIKDYFLSIYWILRIGGRWDIMISLDNLNTLAGLTLRQCGVVKKVVYYTIDFVPKRFSNFFLNELYHGIEKLS